MRKREFTAPNGVKRDFWFRDGTNDESTIIACFEEDYYKIALEEFGEDDVVIDLGAHIGAVSILLSTLPGLRIIAVEPLPENCGLLRKNIEENGLDIKVYERAIWSKSNQELEIFYGDQSEAGRVHRFVGTMNFFDSKSFAKARKSVKVKTISLRSIFKKEKIKTCRFMKIDIEGAEWEAIGGAPGSVLGRVKKIRGEYHIGDYHDLLKKVGVFKDITPRKMDNNFLWRRKRARK